MGQTLLLKQDSVRTFFNIPKPPPADIQPPIKMVNPFTRVAKVIASEKSQGYDAKPEILHGAKEAEVVPKAASTAGTPSTAATAPPVTFSQPPRRKSNS